MIKPGQFPTPRRAKMGIPGRCDRWGCLLPVGPDSTFGPGPVCMVCKLNLRHTALSDEENERWKRTTASL